MSAESKTPLRAFHIKDVKETKPYNGQEYVLVNWFLLDKPYKGHVGAIKFIKADKSDEALEEYANQKHVQETNECGKFTIGASGKWIWLHDDSHELNEKIFDAEGRQILFNKAKEKQQKASDEFLEIQERVKKLQSEQFNLLDESSLTYYSSLHVKSQFYKNYMEAKEKEIRSCEELREKTLMEIEVLDAKHPEYKNQWEQHIKEHQL